MTIRLLQIDTFTDRVLGGSGRLTVTRDGEALVMSRSIFPPRSPGSRA